MTQQEYFDKLDKWSEHAGNGEDRFGAVYNIVRWIHVNDVDAQLDLRGLGLKSLPPMPNSCRSLCIDNNRITSLSGKLPQSLVSLSAERNCLTTLPSALPPGLQYLHVARNRLETLPDLPPDIRLLDASGNRLRAVPESCGRLRHLFVANNLINALPETWSADLEWLDLHANEISRLPADLSRLRVGNINLAGNPLHEQGLANLEGWHQVGGNLGTWFQAMMARDLLEPRSDLSTSPSLEASVTAWYRGRPENEIRKVGAAWRTMNAEVGAADFAQFAGKLRRTVSARIPEFRAAVIEWLDELAANPELRAMTFLLAEEACATCEDRVALTFNEMKKARILDAIDKGKYDDRLEDLIGAIRGVYRCERLDVIASEKVAALKRARGNNEAAEEVDEVQVQLALQVMLKDKLQLPLDVPDMRFFGASYVSEAELKQAEKRVQADENKHFVRYLTADCALWKSALKRLDEPAFTNAQEQIAREKSQVNERMQAELDVLAKARPGEWLEMARTLPERFRNMETEIASRIQLAVTTQILERRGVPLSLLAPHW